MEAPLDQAIHLTVVIESASSKLKDNFALGGNSADSSRVVGNAV
jgi:hypothetical protein